MSDAELCECPAASDDWSHTPDDHRADCPWARGGGPADTACGGCWGCLAAQARYYDGKRQEAGQ